MTLSDRHPRKLRGIARAFAPWARCWPMRRTNVHAMMPLMPKLALIAGALGVVGRAFLEHLETLADWEVVALSRRAPDFPTRARFIAVDLADADDCKAKLHGLVPITHLFYA